MVSDPEYLTTRQAAELLGVPISTFHGWVQAGKLTHAFRAEGIRGALFFRRADIVALTDNPESVAS